MGVHDILTPSCKSLFIVGRPILEIHYKPLKLGIEQIPSFQTWKIMAKRGLLVFCEKKSLSDSSYRDAILQSGSKISALAARLLFRNQLIFPGWWVVALESNGQGIRKIKFQGGGGNCKSSVVLSSVHFILLWDFTGNS